MTWFQFVNSFLSLFYIAFYLQDQEKLKEQLAALLIARQVIGNLKESAWPYLLEQLRIAKLSFDLFGALSPSEAKKPLPKEKTEGDTPDKGRRNISQAELESSLFKYDGTFADHLEMFIQLGYVALFSSAFPMAALCALANNLMELRSDAFKLCFICQRPFGQRVNSIGTWQRAMEAMGLIAVLVNCALIGLSGQVHRMFPEMSTTQTILLIVALEHIMLCIRFAIACAIPDVPEWLATEMAKAEYARREASRRLSSAAGSPAPDAHGGPVAACTTSGVPGSPSSSKAASSSALDEDSPPNALVIGRFVVSPAAAAEAAAQGAAGGSPPPSPPPPDASEPPPAPAPAPVPAPVATASTTASESSLPTPSAAAASSKGASRKTGREWLTAGLGSGWAPGDSLSHHLTIGPHGGAEWARRLGLEARKGSEPQMGGRSSGGRSAGRSTECIAAASDSDLLRAVPPWTPTPKNSSPLSSPAASSSPARASPKEREAAAAAAAAAIAAEDEASAAAAAAAEAAARKTRVKQSLMKRARSVAIFSLKLKERRAQAAQRDAAKSEAKAEAKAEQSKSKAEGKWGLPPTNVGGELSCIPIEKLISVDDVAMDLQRRKNL